MKKIFIYLMSIIFIFSNIKIPTYASGAVAAGLGEFLKGLGYSLVWSVVSEISDEGIDALKSWVSNDKKYYDSHESDEGNEFGGGGHSRTPKYYDGNKNISDAMQNFSSTTNNQFIDNSVTNKYTYSSFSSSVTDSRTYSLIKDSFNTTNNYLLYNPITNNYTEVNNISYNNQYDTYYITNNEYNYYVTNNYTYYSYYIINNETGEDSYCEVYYEMPDGRNSYDLEVSDVWGEYFVYDVVGYESVQEDDGKTLGLYHLNGDGKDSSYWNNPDLSLGSGIFQESKFDYGLAVSKNNEVRYILPDTFDRKNFTLEFTIVYLSGTYSGGQMMLVGGFTGDSYVNSSGTTYYYYDNLILYTMKEQGIYSIVVQCDNGTYSSYVNGIKKEYSSSSRSITSSKSVPNSKAFIYFDSNWEYLYLNPGLDTTWNYVIDEVRLSNCALYSESNISVMNQEFDTNQVLCLPENPYDSLIAVQGSQDVSGYRIGGVRPTYPTNGYVYIYLEDDVVKDIQQFQNDGWYSINGCIYLDGEWKELKEYNLSSLVFEEDDYNSGGTGSGGGSEDSGGTGSGGSGSDDSGGTGSGGSVSDNDTGSGGGLSGFLSGLGNIGDAILSILGKLLEYIGKALELLTGTVTKVLDLIPSNVTNLLLGLFPFIPQEWITAIELSLVLGVVLAVVGAFKK